MQEWFQRIGMLFLIGLMVFVFYNDIVNFKLAEKVKKLVISEPKSLNENPELQQGE